MGLRSPRGLESLLGSVPGMSGCPATATPREPRTPDVKEGPPHRGTGLPSVPDSRRPPRADMPVALALESAKDQRSRIGPSHTDLWCGVRRRARRTAPCRALARPGRSAREVGAHRRRWLRSRGTRTASPWHSSVRRPTGKAHAQVKMVVASATSPWLKRLRRLPPATTRRSCPTPGARCIKPAPAARVGLQVGCGPEGRRWTKA
jgi:hypothetical protein